MSSADDSKKNADKRASRDLGSVARQSVSETGYIFNQGQTSAPGKFARYGVGLLVLIGLIVAGLIGTFLYLGEEAAEPFLLFLLGALAVVGIFTLFAAAVGLLSFGTGGNSSPVDYNVLEALDDAHVLSGRDGRILFADATYAKLIGAVSAHDIRSVERVFGVEEGLNEPLFRLSVAAAERRVLSEEIRLEKPLGIKGDKPNGPFWYRLSTYPVADKNEEQQTTLWRVADITRERTEQEFAFQELQNVINYLDHAPVGFFSAEADGKISYINATLAGWLGLDLTEFEVGRIHLYEVVRGDGAALLNTTKGEAGTTHTEVIDIDFVKDNGQSLPVRLLHLTPFMDNGVPGPTRTVVLNRSGGDADDVDAMDSNAQFSRFFNSAPIAIATLNDKGELARANASFVSLFKTGKTDTCDIALFDLISNNDREKLLQGIKAARDGQSEILPVDVALKGELESCARLFISTVESSDTESEDGEGAEQEIAVLYAIDTTQQRVLELQFAQSQKMQGIGQLAGGIAHDFNNMLTAILGFSDLLLQKHSQTDPSFQDIMNIKNSASKAAGLVRQLLAFSRRQTLRPTIIDLRDVIEDSVNLLERLLEDKVKLEVTHSRDLWPVKADVNQLEQVIMNLTVNARDAMSKGGKLTIETSNLASDQCDTESMKGLVPAEYVLIKVADNGTGMSPETMEKIFEPFFSTKDVGEGTGLGLATVYGIIKQTGGYIYPVSEVGIGTTFNILLPRHIVIEGEEAKTKTLEKPVDLSGEGNILLVEDEEAVRAFSSRALQARGYTVHEASSGIDALEKMKEVGHEIDLVVSDVVMPEMDGPTLLGELRKDYPNLKFIFVSGYAEEAFEKHLTEGVKFAFLPKPFSLKQLSTKVKEVMGMDAEQDEE
ncbi:MAG: response regulator [Hyphomicrobiales bacterium]